MSNNIIAVIDTRMSDKCKNGLIKRGFSLIEIPCNKQYDMPISAHPDIFMFKCHGTFVLEKGIKHKKHLFENRGYKVYVESSTYENKTYPNDCTLNFAVCGKYIIGNKKICSSHILEIANDYNMMFIDVNQGYAKCNICVVNDNAIITEDKGIAKSCKAVGIEVLLLNTNSVKLDGYKNGFIGGATGMLHNEHNENNVIYFCGDVTTHPEYEDIRLFCKKHNADIVSLSDEPLYDRGSIIFI